MRFVSLCAVLGAALISVVGAGPCKPKTTSVVTTTTAGTETLSTDTETKTNTQSIVTSDATSLLETTLTGTETATTDEATVENTFTESATLSETTTFVSDYTT